MPLVHLLCVPATPIRQSFPAHTYRHVIVYWWVLEGRTTRTTEWGSPVAARASFRAGAARASFRAGAAREWRARDEREHDEEVAQEGRHCGRAAWNSTTSARLRLADDLHYKVQLSLSASDSRATQLYRALRRWRT